MTQLPAIARIKFGGMCEPFNPGGHATWAWAAYSRTGREQTHDSGYIGHGPGMTNNISDYTALIRALTWLRDTCRKTDHTTRCSSDSQLIIKQMTGEYGVRAAVLIPLHQAARDLLRTVHVTFEWERKELDAGVWNYCKAALPDGVHPRIRKG